MSSSGTTSVFPKESNICRALPSSSSVTRPFAQIALIASPTRAGVFGIALTTFASLPSPSSMDAMERPAAMETTRHSSLKCGAISGSTPPSAAGLTARIRMSLLCATSAFEGVVSIEKRARTASRVLGERALAMSCPVVAREDFRMPPIMALPMFPAPIKPII